jgi:hypothetical protein
VIKKDGACAYRDEEGNYQSRHPVFGDIWRIGKIKYSILMVSDYREYQMNELKKEGFFY